MGPSLEELDQAQRESWARAADAWERRQEELRQALGTVSDWMVAAIDPQPGERVLELAAGPGETGFIALQRMGRGTLVSSDQADAMVDVARRRAGELGLDGVQFMVLDAQRLELEPEQFDAVLCRFGYMLMADRAAALRGTHRVLKPEGRLALAVWDTPDRNMWLAVPAMQLIARGALQMPEPGTPTPFALANPGELEQLLRDAGFSEVAIEKVEFSQTYDSFEHFWDITLDLGAPIAAALAEIDADARDSVRAAARDVLSQFTSADGVITVPASAVVARAVA